MTIENTLERIAVSLEQIVANLTAPTPVQQQPAPIPIPQMSAPQPQYQAPPSQPQYQAPVQQAPQAPAPQYVPPVPAPQPQAPQQSQYPAAPFTDSNGAMQYCVEKYRALGPVKGAEIQTILLSLGCQQIATLRPDQFGEFFYRVESL